MNTSHVREKLEHTLESVMEQIEDGLRRGRFTADDLQEAIAERSKAAARQANDYVHDHPWKALGVVAVLGAVVGWFMRRH